MIKRNDNLILHLGSKMKRPVKRPVKLKELLAEKYSFERSFGEPLPTLDDTTTAKTLQEKKIPLAKITTAHVDSGEDRKFIDGLIKAGFRGELNESTYGLDLHYNGLPVKLRMADENVYMEFPELYVKDAQVKLVMALKNFLKFISNYGGSKK